jgi:BMFP domain-containing protein YqiC
MERSEFEAPRRLARPSWSALHSPPSAINSTEQSRGFAMSTTGPNRILDELAKLMTDAAGAAQGVRREVEQAFRAQAERLLNSMEVVQREEFEAARDMAVKARAENKALAARLDALEAKLVEISGSAASGAASGGETQK